MNERKIDIIALILKESRCDIIQGYLDVTHAYFNRYL